MKIRGEVPENFLQGSGSSEVPEGFGGEDAW